MKTNNDSTVESSPRALTEQIVWEALRQVIDPELGFNIVDLGLVYSVAVRDRTVDVVMTLTTRGCPMHESLMHGVREALFQMEEVEEVNVDLVWDPPWNPDMMSGEAQAQLR